MRIELQPERLQPQFELWPDASVGPLVRTRLLRLGETEHVLLLTLHHIVSDAWSIGIMVREVSALYEAFAHGRRSTLIELPIQYADFAVWQAEWLQGAVLESYLTYWREQLKDAAGALALPPPALAQASR